MHISRCHHHLLFFLVRKCIGVSAGLLDEASLLIPKYNKIKIVKHLFVGQLFSTLRDIIGFRKTIIENGWRSEQFEFSI